VNNKCLPCCNLMNLGDSHSLEKFQMVLQSESLPKILSYPGWKPDVSDPLGLGVENAHVQLLQHSPPHCVVWVPVSVDETADPVNLFAFQALCNVLWRVE